MKRFAIWGLIGAAVALAGCTRIETGTVGVRVDFNKQVESNELLPGSWNQTVVGDVLTFPVKDVQVDVTNLTPLASDNSTVQDFDIAVIYSVNPSSVAELWVEKNRAFHAQNEARDILLMYNYVHQIARNAAYKSARNHRALEMNDKRAQMEVDIREQMIASLAEENLGTSINISQVLIRNIMPDQKIVQSANDLVQAQNERLRKEVEVQTAKLEAERIAALNANKGAVEYMNAMANVTIAEAVKAGKVNTIIIPSNLTMLGSVTK